MDTHSRIKKHQTEAASDNAGPVSFWLMKTRQKILAGSWERWLLTGMCIVSAVTWVPARP